jgi:hypothetical protein
MNYSSHSRALARLPTHDCGNGRYAFEGVKPLSDAVSVGVFNLTVES